MRPVNASKLHVAAETFVPEIRSGMEKIAKASVAELPSLLQRLPVWRDALRPGFITKLLPIAVRHCGEPLWNAGKPAQRTEETKSGFHPSQPWGPRVI